MQILKIHTFIKKRLEKKNLNFRSTKLKSYVFKAFEMKKFHTENRKKKQKLKCCTFVNQNLHN